MFFFLVKAFAAAPSLVMPLTVSLKESFAAAAAAALGYILVHQEAGSCCFLVFAGEALFEGLGFVESDPFPPIFH